MEKLIDTRVSALEYWRNGNGTKGAAQTIEEHDLRIKDIELHHAQEELIIIRAVKRAIKEYNRSALAYIKVFAPYFASIVALIISLLTK